MGAVRNIDPIRGDCDVKENMNSTIMNK